MWYYLLFGVIIILILIIIFEYKNKIKLNEEIKIINKKLDELKSKDDNTATIFSDLEESTFDEHKEIIKDSLNLNVNLENDSLTDSPITNNIIGKTITDINEEKQKIFNEMENTNNNIFITGKAGTGKSYLLKYFRENTSKKVLYTAPTGIAALNIEGVTLHTAFGWNNLLDEHEIKISNNKKELFNSTDTIIIDEISMVRVDVFNQIDKILRYATGIDKPFGGKQMILMGDLFQLPPVANKEESEFFTDKYGGIFFFNSSAYKEGKFIFKELEEVFRQSEKVFIDILNNIREGKVTSDDINNLNKHYVPEVPRRVVQVVPKKDEANKINYENLNKIDLQEYTYLANIVIGDNNLKETDFPCDFTLKLKVGALVMMITNDQEHRRWVNGTLGIVSKLDINSVTVTINGTDFEISPVPFNKYKCEYDRNEKKLKYIVESSVNQYPLILAYAITIHKSQGMTYQQIACNLESCFAPGQAYVALSRCANFDKLYLTKKVDPRSIITDNIVTNFYLEQKNNLN